MNRSQERDNGEGERMTPGGTTVPPRNASGTPTEDGKLPTEEAERAEHTELASGRSVDKKGRPLGDLPPPVPSRDKD